MHGSEERGVVAQKESGVAVAVAVQERAQSGSGGVQPRKRRVAAAAVQKLADSRGGMERDVERSALWLGGAARGMVEPNEAAESGAWWRGKRCGSTERGAALQ